MSKVISIDSTRYVLPEGMTSKDVQALAGFLVTLTKIDSHYLWGNGEYAYSADRGAEVRIEELDLMTKAEAKALSDKSRAEYEAKKESSTA